MITDDYVYVEILQELDVNIDQLLLTLKFDLPQKGEIEDKILNFFSLSIEQRYSQIIRMSEQAKLELISKYYLYIKQ